MKRPGLKVYSRPWRAWFRRRYWVVCWHCDLYRGPYLTEEEQVKHLMHECTDPPVLYGTVLRA